MPAISEGIEFDFKNPISPPKQERIPVTIASDIFDRNLQPMQVEGLIYYPVKSCRGIQVNHVQLTPSGILYDRWWIIVKNTKVRPKEMLTQRHEPKMVTIIPSVKDGILTLNAHGMPAITVEPISGILETVKVWDDITQGYDQGDAVSDWLSMYLGQPVRLLAKDSAFARPLPAKHSPSLEKFEYQPQVSFADGYPLLLLSANSVEEFKTHHEYPDSISFENFRPNILITKAEAYEEDKLIEFKINEIVFYGGMLCTRCTMTNNDPATGVPRGETLKLLSRIRRVDTGAKYQACMGINVIHSKLGSLSVGDKVTVLKTGQHNRNGIWNQNSFPQ